MLYIPPEKKIIEVDFTPAPSGGETTPGEETGKILPFSRQPKAGGTNTPAALFGPQRYFKKM